MQKETMSTVNKYLPKLKMVKVHVGILCPAPTIPTLRVRTVEANKDQIKLHYQI